MGTPANSNMLRHTAWSGQRNATRFKPPVARSGTRSDLGNVIVKGPGQKASIKAFAVLGISFTSGLILSALGTCNINGLSDGRPLAA